ncbi:hypothetical protein Ga0080559_TMP4756 [Salipiger profundus]|uniref:Uncharacterized protein n=1 Tax=Salipiger profundus TaxID=1229727 RepID=A0A1U7DBR7_9RHOB|nr:hypothetical protein Ga0080559_TMP4756 [Salipiger profundus]
MRPCVSWHLRSRCGGFYRNHRGKVNQHGILNANSWVLGDTEGPKGALIPRIP